jgi:hypothetical protein
MSALGQAGLVCNFFAGHTPRSQVLAEVEGLVAPRDPRIQRLLELDGEAVAWVVPIGGYAAPLASTDLA